MTLEKAYDRVRNSHPLVTEAVIHAKFDDGTKKTVNLKDEYARKVLGFAGRLSEKLEQAIREWITNGDWNSKDAQRYLPSAIMSIMDKHYDLDSIEDVRNIVAGINALTEADNKIIVFEPNLVNNTNFLKFFYDMLERVPQAKIFDNDRFIFDMIKRLDFSEGKVAVGPGEVFITLFSEAVNPSKGDIVTANGHEVEVKGDGGRLGKSDVEQAALRAMKKIEEVIPQTFAARQQEIENALYNISTYYYNKLKTPGRVQTNLIRFNEIIRKIHQQKFDIDLKGLDRPAVIRAAEKEYDEIFGSQEDISPTQIINYIDEYNKMETGEFTKNFTAFFRSTNDQDLIVDIISEFSANREYQIDDIIKQALTDTDPVNIVGAIQAVDYQKKEDFMYLLLFSSKDFRQISIGPFSDDYRANLARAIEAMKNAKVLANPQRGAGFRVLI